MSGSPARSRPEGCLSDLAFDRLIDGELAGTAALRAVEAHLGVCALCRARRAELAAGPVFAPDPAWPVVAGPLPAAADVATAPARGRRRAPWLAVGAAALAVAAAAVVASVTLLSESKGTRRGIEIAANDVTSDLDPGQSTRTKGRDLGLDLLVKGSGASSAEPVLPDVPLHPGDAIGFRVRAAEPGYLVIVGLDGRGQVSDYTPPSGGPLFLAAPGARALDGSVVLDGALGEERVLALLCRRREDAARSLEVARAALAAAGSPARVARLDLPCLQAHASFVKSGKATKAGAAP